MQAQSLGQHNVYAWLSVLSAKLSADSVGHDLRELAKSCPIPFAVIDLRKRDVTYLSPTFAKILSVDQMPDGWRATSALADRSELVASLLQLMLDHSIDSYQVRRSFRAGDGRRVESYNWVAACGTRNQGVALWILVPAGEVPALTRVDPVGHGWPEDNAGIVLGRFDAEWKVLRIDAGVSRLLGHTAASLVGHSLLSFVHPVDVSIAMQTATRAVADRIGVGAVIRMRHHDGTWYSTRIIVSPLVEDDLQFGFALSIVRGGTESSAARVAELERRLWHIAQEVESAGIAFGFQRLEPPDALPELRDLSARQWEVLNRLIQGDRVPQIAERLFISQNTVRNHLSAIYQKLGVNSQGALIERLRGVQK